MFTQFKNLYKLLFIYFIFYLILKEQKIKKKIRTFINTTYISIINAQYLPLCLDTILNQSVKNIEIICIDDGSSDNSVEILKNLKKNDNRIIIIQQENKGSGPSRNLGIKLSKGKYICFMDSDDLYPNQLILELMANKADQNNAIIAGGGIMNFVQEKNQINLIMNSEIYFKEDGLIKYIDYQYDWFYQRFIYNKHFLKKNKIFFPNYLRYQDPPFFINLLITSNF